jgi:hypothetical protein
MGHAWIRDAADGLVITHRESHREYESHGAKVRLKMATKEPLRARVYDPEMDMKRTVEFHARIKILLVVAAALRWLAPGLCRIETPRRSVDRELGQSSSSWE